jgi:hypothetical protein
VHGAPKSAKRQNLLEREWTTTLDEVIDTDAGALGGETRCPEFKKGRGMEHTPEDNAPLMISKPTYLTSPLIAPDSFWQLSNDEFRKYCNG